MSDPRSSALLRILRLYCDRPFTHTGSHLRGALIAAYPDRELLHNRRSDGVARLPDVRYLVHEQVPHVVSIGDGHDELLEIYGQVEHIPVPGGLYAVSGCELIDLPLLVGPSDRLVRYHSITPWLALNQKNYDAYQKLTGRRERLRLLSRILVGNFLMALRQMGVEVDEGVTITALVDRAREQWVRVRDQQLLGIKAEFTANMVWTHWLGLGKQPSKGFGRFIEVL